MKCKNNAKQQRTRAVQELLYCPLLFIQRAVSSFHTALHFTHLQQWVMLMTLHRKNNVSIW